MASGPWTSLYGKTEEDSYHFFSAYYDDRRSVAGSPLVLVMGYAYKKVPVVYVYCAFVFSNGSRTCSKRPAGRKHPTSCYTPNLPALSFVYTCSLRSLNLHSPLVSSASLVSVQMSTDANCDPRLSTSEIRVVNFNHTKSKVISKEFGVCVQSPLIQEDNENILQGVVEFIEMSRLLGAELIVFYVNETQVDSYLLDYVRSRYPHMVRMIGWRKFKKWQPLHYYGQLLLISDCMYRLMYEVEYLVMIDWDEMLMPVKHTSWHDMVMSFPTKKRSNMYSTFRFLNTFFDSPSDPPKLPNCHNMSLPKYLHKTTHYKCLVDRPKSILRPRLIVEPSVHGRCKALDLHEMIYHVPRSVAFNAHYRDTTEAEECTEGRMVVDTMAMRFSDALTTAMCS